MFFKSGNDYARARTVQALVVTLFLLVYSCFSRVYAETETGHDLPIAKTEQHPAPSEEIETIPVNKKKSTISRIDSSRQYLGEKYLALTRNIDGFLSRRYEESNYDFNELETSYLKADIQTTFFDSGGEEQDFRLKVKVDLPRTEHRLKLFFDSDLDEEDSLESHLRSVSTGDRVSGDSAVAGLEINGRKKKGARKLLPSAQIGARFSSGVKPFIRFRASKKIKAIGWHLRARQDVWYLAGVGWGETTRLDSKKYLGRGCTFLTQTEVEYRKREDLWALGHRWVVSYLYSEKLSVNYRLGHLRTEGAQSLFDRHFANVGIRRNMYEDWLYLTLTPEIAYDVEQDWDVERSITLKTEVFFTE